MAAGSYNFPPPTIVPEGSFTLTSQSGSVPSSVLFTAPVTGVYSIGLTTHLVSTNNAGTLTVTYSWGTQGLTVTATPNIATGQDAQAVQQIWLNAGQTINVVTVATGLTGTVYHLILSAQRVL